MKIVFISDQFYPRTSADSEQIISSLSALSKFAEVTLISAKYSSKDATTQERLESYYGRSCPFKLEFINHLFPFIRGIEKLTFALKVAFKVRNNNADFVYTRNIPIVLFTLLFTSHKVVFESYRPWPERNILSRLFFKRMAINKKFVGVVLHSKFAGESFKNVGFKPQNLLVAHNAFDFSVYNEVPKNEVCNNYDIPDNRIIVTYSGRVNVNKGLDRLFLLAEEFPEIFFLIVGSEREGEIEEQAKKFDNVKVLGWLSRADVFSILTSSDILYIPTTLRAREVSKNTVLPIKTFIYKASGTAIFAPKSEDLLEVLEHKENAYLVNPDDWESEKMGFSELIKDNELRNRLGTSAQFQMMDNTWDARAKNILRFLRNQ